MMKITQISALFLTLLLAGSLGLSPVSVHAQSDDRDESAAEESEQSEDGPVESDEDEDEGGPEVTEASERMVVTGSRIRRIDLETSTPVSVIDSEELEARGYTNVAEALLNSPLTSGSATPQNIDYDGSAIGSGQYFINLGNLGSQRTLTLVNGRRMVSSNSAGNGAGGNQVDASIIPTGLVDRIEIMQVGGAAVYGTDAISGVINYILKRDFEGVEVDVQYGDTSERDFGVTSVRGTFGKNFLDRRANVALNVEYSDTPSLLASERDPTARAYATVANPDYNGPGEGVPARLPILDRRFPEFNEHGVLFSIPAPLPMFLVSSDGAPLQFDSNGNLRPYDPGEYYQPAFASGGDGYEYADLAALHSSVERLNTYLIGHIDLTPHVRLSTELLFSNVDRVDPFSSQIYNSTLQSGPSAAIQFGLDNPYLTDQARDVLENASYFIPGQGQLPYVGQPIYLSKAWEDLLPSRASRDETDTWRAMIGLEGDWLVNNKNYYWSVSASLGKTSGSSSNWGVNQQRFEYAINATRDGNGNIVCADPAPENCAPINPFGHGNVSQAARDYVSVLFRNEYENRQQNLLAILGGTLFDLPTGPVPFSLGYEYRSEEATFTPNQAAARGIGRGQAIVGISGDYDTHELFAELDIPLVGDRQALAFAQRVDLNSAVRVVENSLAGTEFVWNVGLNWTFNDHLKFRATRGRSFRTPSLTELFLPERTQSMSAVLDPCDQRNIDGGLNPSIRRENCQAMFDELGIDGTDFTSNAQNFAIEGTLAGNPELDSESSDSLSFGFVWQPSFIENLNITLDHIDIEIEDAIESFTLQNSLQVCYDSAEQPDDICGLFERDDEGQIVDARSSFINAGHKRYRAQNLAAHYTTNALSGRFDFQLKATHVDLNEQSVTGFDRTRIDGTVEQPSWKAKLNVRYSRGQFRAGYFIDYLPSTLSSFDATRETTPDYRIASNIVHSLSLAYMPNESAAFRFGVKNLFDNEPSYPTVHYGDILGRRYYVGMNYRF